MQRASIAIYFLFVNIYIFFFYLTYIFKPTPFQQHDLITIGPDYVKSYHFFFFTPVSEALVARNRSSFELHPNKLRFVGSLQGTKW